MVEPLYHVHSFEDKIEAHDSLVPTLRQRRKIVEPLYHVHSFENRIAAHDSLVPTARQRRRIVEPLYHGIDAISIQRAKF